MNNMQNHPHNHVQQPMGQIRTMQMIQVQTPQGPQWVPYQPAMGAAPQPQQAGLGGALGQLVTGLLPKLAIGVGLFFAGKWVYGKIKQHEANRLEEDGWSASEAEEDGPSYVSAHERRRSRSRLLKEVDRFVTAHADEQVAGASEE